MAHINDIVTKANGACLSTSIRSDYITLFITLGDLQSEVGE